MSEEKKICLRDTIVPKSDQLNYDDVMAGPLQVKVTGLAIGSDEQPVVVKVASLKTGEKLRDYKPCKSMRRVLIKCWGDEGRLWIGKAMTLVGDAGVVFGGAKVGGIRISALSGIDKPERIMLTTTRSKRAEYIVEPMATPAAQAQA
jgi:hypothetical protein